jgi:hypothetical protein
LQSLLPGYGLPYPVALWSGDITPHTVTEIAPSVSINHGVRCLK